MCATCGCSDDGDVLLTDMQKGTAVVLNDMKNSGLELEERDHHAHTREHGYEHSHTHDHEHGQGHSHSHEHAQAHGTVVKLEQAIFDKNNRFAERNRGWLAGRR